ncbi:protein of unknown function (plasmid) [Cupriavidus taiwanensis]|uniref:Uncharacterized protein n=1 Tax=Cupriavidus taiwanensis TaxID=164546 RepID=A0A375HAF5_9BURK|nr:protein of unknown function [Cupriavidus taiwanensis]SPD48752.1 protein of unknown function [Cupriavidus taiwanensis]
MWVNHTSEPISSPSGLKVFSLEDANAPHTKKGVLRIRHPRLPVIKFWQWATDTRP